MLQSADPVDNRLLNLYKERDDARLVRHISGKPLTDQVIYQNQLDDVGNKIPILCKQPLDSLENDAKRSNSLKVIQNETKTDK